MYNIKKRGRPLLLGEELLSEGYQRERWSIDTVTTVLMSCVEAMDKTVDKKLLKQFDVPVNLSRAGLSLS